LAGGFELGMPSRRTNNFTESGRGLGHVTLQFLAVRSAILATAWPLVQVGMVCQVAFHRRQILSFCGCLISSKSNVRNRRTDGRTDDVQHLMLPPREGRIITLSSLRGFWITFVV